MPKNPLTRFHFRPDWLQRIDRLAADLNAPLVLLAIGLAMLDLTVLVAQQVIDGLPPITHSAASVAPPTSPASLAGDPFTR